MSEKNHEPGPWEVNDQRGNGWLANAMYVSSGNTGAILARVYDDQGSEFPNARLIAAAPELLEALQAICAHWDAGNFSRQPNLWDGMRAAIAKATGQ
jgi:hypothetical protein